jgi:hypothetical protein
MCTRRSGKQFGALAQANTTMSFAAIMAFTCASAMPTVLLCVVRRCAPWYGLSGHMRKARGRGATEPESSTEAPRSAQYMQTLVDGRVEQTRTGSKLSEPRQIYEPAARAPAEFVRQQPRASTARQGLANGRIGTVAERAPHASRLMLHSSLTCVRCVFPTCPRSSRYDSCAFETRDALVLVPSLAAISSLAERLCKQAPAPSVATRSPVRRDPAVCPLSVICCTLAEWCPFPLVAPPSVRLLKRYAANLVLRQPARGTRQLCQLGFGPASDTSSCSNGFVPSAHLTHRPASGRLGTLSQAHPFAERRTCCAAQPLSLLHLCSPGETAATSKLEQLLLAWKIVFQEITVRAHLGLPPLQTRDRANHE